MLQICYEAVKTIPELWTLYKQFCYRLTHVLPLRLSESWTIFLQRDTCCWLWHCCEGSFVILALSLADWIEATTSTWWVTTQISKLLREKWRATTTGSSTTYYLVRISTEKNFSRLCENSIMQSKTSIVKSLLRAVQAHKFERTF